MNIGILTQPLLNNYGGLLQNYALQRALVKLGHDPITIDQRPPQLPSWYVALGRLKGLMLYYLNPSKHLKPHYNLNLKEKSIIEQNTRSFIEKHIIHTWKCEGTKDFISATLHNKIEALIVGSDQCWRPAYNDYLEDMFLRYANNLPLKKRIAYAASFGTDKWEFSPQQTKECSALIKQFDLITVREESGVGLCKDYFGVDAVQVLDPTMLLLKEDYCDLVVDSGVNQSDGTLFNYLLDPNEKKCQFVKHISDKLILKPFQVLPKYNEDHRARKNVKKDIENCIYPSPLAWLRAFVDSEMTIVDSFHGVVFSIIFNKPFWVIGNPERGMARFNSLLNTFELTDRLIREDQFDSIDYAKSIDWGNVNNILNEKRAESLHYLEAVLK